LLPHEDHGMPFSPQEKVQILMTMNPTTAVGNMTIDRLQQGLLAQIDVLFELITGFSHEQFITAETVQAAKNHLESESPRYSTELDELTDV
jgi:hypothetical protein